MHRIWISQEKTGWHLHLLMPSKQKKNCNCLSFYNGPMEGVVDSRCEYGHGVTELQWSGIQAGTHSDREQDSLSPFHPYNPVTCRRAMGKLKMHKGPHKLALLVGWEPWRAKMGPAPSHTNPQRQLLPLHEASISALMAPADLALIIVPLHRPAMWSRRGDWKLKEIM